MSPLRINDHYDNLQLTCEHLEHLEALCTRNTTLCISQGKQVLRSPQAIPEFIGNRRNVNKTFKIT